MIFVYAIFIASLIDVFVGWPKPLYSKVGHPVTWMGFLINNLDTMLNKSYFKNETRKLFGFITLVILIVFFGLISFYIQASVMVVFDLVLFKVILLGILFWPLLAFKSMIDHVFAVYKTLCTGNIIEARITVSNIVGRNTDEMGESEIVRACVESLAENTSDGLVAPIFWAVFFGLPGLVCYKVINTLDSMIGYKTEKYNYFGWASARLDDLVNYFPARLTCLLFAIVSVKPFDILRVSSKEAKMHRSPNAGWPESAMAWSIGIRLSGPRTYEGNLINESWLNSGGSIGSKLDILNALKVFRKSMATFVFSLVSLALFIDLSGYFLR